MRGLRSGWRHSVGGRRRGWDALIGTEVGLAVVLLVAVFVVAAPPAA